MGQIWATQSTSAGNYLWDSLVVGLIRHESQPYQAQMQKTPPSGLGGRFWSRIRVQASG
jgi:hypothetical protein